MARPRITILLAIFGTGLLQTLAAQAGGGPAGRNSPVSGHPYATALGALANYRSCGRRVRAADVDGFAGLLRRIESHAAEKGLAPMLGRLRRDHDHVLAVSTMAACGGGPEAARDELNQSLWILVGWVTDQPDGR